MAGPEVPFPISLSFTEMNDGAGALCRDCPFPLVVDDQEIPFPLPVANIPETVKDLIGMRCRVIKPGDHITLDYNPNRVNIIVDERAVIKNISFG